MAKIQKLLEIQAQIKGHDSTYTSIDIRCGCGGGATNCNGNF